MNGFRIILNQTGNQRGFLPIVVALGIVTILGGMSLSLSISSAIANKRMARRIDALEAFFSNELLVWHSRLRSQDGLLTSGNKVKVLIFNAPTVNVEGNEPDSINGSPGQSVNVLTTQAFAQATILVRRNLSGSLTHQSTLKGSCGYSNFTAKGKINKVCLWEMAAASPKGDCGNPRLLPVGFNLPYCKGLVPLPEGWDDPQRLQPIRSNMEFTQMAEGGRYYLANDLVWNDGSGGAPEKSGGGIFLDGRGHTIRGLVNLPPFSNLKNSAVVNIRFDGILLSDGVARPLAVFPTVYGGTCLDNIVVTGRLFNSLTDTPRTLGGLAGFVTVKDASGINSIGPTVLSNILTNVAVEEADNIRASNEYGGVVGYASGTAEFPVTFINTSACGLVTGGWYSGGLIGNAENSRIERSSSFGNVTVKILGLVGAGGLVGQIDTGSVISDSYSHGGVEVISSGFSPTVPRIGGFVGYFKGGTILCSYSTGKITGTGETQGSSVDAFAGGAAGQYCGNIVEFNSSGCCQTTIAFRKSAAEMQTQAAFSIVGTPCTSGLPATGQNCWDFSRVWNPPLDGKYPTLR